MPNNQETTVLRDAIKIMSTLYTQTTKVKHINGTKSMLPESFVTQRLVNNSTDRR